MNNIKRGAFIVIEGVDRSGKSTQCKKLVEKLKNMNIPAQLMCFPDRTTKTGKLIDEYLKNENCNLNDQTIHLLFSANRWENVEKIKSLLFQGTTLIVDRYSYSGIVFSTAKNNMDLKWYKQPEIGLPRPDLVMLLTLNMEEMSKRPGFGDERYENTKMQERVSGLYNQLLDERWEVIDASGTLEEVHNILLENVLKTIDKSQMLELDVLDFNNKNTLKENHLNGSADNKIFKI